MKALHLPWVRQCLTAALFCSSVHRSRLRSASLPPFSCHFLCQLASCARLRYPSSRMAAVALRPYLMQGSTVLFLCSREYTPSSKRHRLVRISGTTLIWTVAGAPSTTDIVVRQRLPKSRLNAPAQLGAFFCRWACLKKGAALAVLPSTPRHSCPFGRLLEKSICTKLTFS